MPETCALYAALYARVSTVDQTEANQLPELHQLAQRRGWSPVEYREVESGAKARPVLDRMLADARAGKVGAIVVWALDRLSREGALPVLHLVTELDRHGVALVSVREPWLDTSQDNPFRDVLVTFAATLAKLERARLIERTKLGLARVAREARDRSGPSKKQDRNAKGWPAGRPPASPVLLSAAAELVGQHLALGRLYKHRVSIREAARVKGVKESTLRRFLASQAARPRVDAPKRPPRDSGAPS